MTIQSVTLDATLESLPKLMGWVETVVTPLPLSVQQIQLVVEEAFVNIVHYSYGDMGGKVTLSVDYQPDKQLIFEIRDSGHPFDPTRPSPLIDRTSSLERRREGGLGLMLMKKFMTEVRYRREGQENVLTLIRKL
ncbi:MAG: Serine/threonine-protein kinase BtrW [Chlamydiae bacterium]|nr:Serine/threonine-protein kinase BtrW [Chlamydiota bacterium]